MWFVQDIGCFDVIHRLFQELFDTEKTLNAPCLHRSGSCRFWYMAGSLHMHRSNFEVTPACYISEYCTTPSPPAPNEGRNGSVQRNTSAKKRAGHIASTQERSWIRKWWKYVTQVPTSPGLPDTASFKMLICFQTFNESFLNMKQQLVFNASRVQGRAGLPIVTATMFAISF